MPLDERDGSSLAATTTGRQRATWSPSSRRPEIRPRCRREVRARRRDASAPPPRLSALAERLLAVETWIGRRSLDRGGPLAKTPAVASERNELSGESPTRSPSLLPATRGARTPTSFYRTDGKPGSATAATFVDSSPAANVGGMRRDVERRERRLVGGRSIAPGRVDLVARRVVRERAHASDRGIERRLELPGAEARSRELDDRVERILDNVDDGLADPRRPDALQPRRPRLPVDAGVVVEQAEQLGLVQLALGPEASGHAGLAGPGSSLAGCDEVAHDVALTNRMPEDAAPRHERVSDDGARRDARSGDVHPEPVSRTRIAPWRRRALWRADPAAPRPFRGRPRSSAARTRSTGPACSSPRTRRGASTTAIRSISYVLPVHSYLTFGHAESRDLEGEAEVGDERIDPPVGGRSPPARPEAVPDQVRIGRDRQRDEDVVPQREDGRVLEVETRRLERVP